MKSLARGLTGTPRKLNARILTSLAAALGLAMCCAGALAQSGEGSIQGTVSDATGAVIPAVAVHVVNAATGVAADTKSNHVGFYQIPGLFTGTYRVIFAAPGMKTYTTSIELLVAQNAVINPVLTAGAVTQQVIVAGNAVQLTNPDNGVISSTLERARIDQLPENGRLLTTLTQMSVPGLEDSGERPNGLLPEALQYLADGVTTTNMQYGAEHNASEQLVDPDSVQEVQVQLTNTSAQYATPATAIMTTKSGTNSLHGTAFETARNNALGIAKGRGDAANYAAPAYVRNEFGASAGGPIVLPHLYHGKDKSFWFFAYERYSLAQTTSALYEVPTTAMRQGDFSGLISSQGIPQTLYDPSTTTNSSKCAATGGANTYCRTAFPNNAIPASELSPATQVLFDMEPQPTSSADPLVNDNLIATAPNFQEIPQVTFRLDHVFNDNNRAYLRFSDVDSPVVISGSPRSLPADGFVSGAGEGYTNNPTQSFLTAAGYTHVFSPTFFAETIAAQQWYEQYSNNGNDPRVNYEAKLGLPNNFGEWGFPATSGLINNFSSSQTSYNFSQIISDLQENVTKIVGPHQLLFGGAFRHIRVGQHPLGFADTITFQGDATGIYEPSSGSNYDDEPNSGYADADFFLGSASEYSVYLQPPYLHYHTNELDAYLQDNYHVRKNLVLNLGLRYEAHPAPFIKYGLSTGIDFKTGALVTAAPLSTLIAEGYTTQAIINNDENIEMSFETPADAGLPDDTSLMRDYNLTVLPRAGVAYQLGRTVIRGGYGRYTYMTPAQDYLNKTEKQNPLTGEFYQSYSTAAQAIDGLPDELLRYNDPVKFGEMGVNTANVVNASVSTAILPGISLWVNAPNWAPAYVSEGNFTVERPFKGDSTLRVSYVWAHSSNLDVAQYFNYHPTNYEWELANGIVPPTGGASVIGTSQQDTYSTTATGPFNKTIWASGSTEHMKTGWTSSDTLQVNYQRLYRHGIAYQIYYVFGKSYRVGGDEQLLDNTDIYPYADYPGAEGTVATVTSPYGTIGPSRVPPPPPANVPVWANYHALDRFADYEIQTEQPFHHIQFNGIVDLPFGRGKRFFGNANRFVNEVIGGFQIAGDGSIVSQEYQPPDTYSGPVSPLKSWRKKYPVVDCSSGVCVKAFMYYNGYLAPKVTQGVAGSVCTTDCITGLPADYVPAEQPIDNTPGTTYFGTEEVQITAPNINAGKATNIVYDSGPGGRGNYYNHAWLLGPWNWEADASIFKVFPITERVNLRIDMDAFNAFNVQGYNNPGANGEEEVEPGAGVATSYNTPRQIQLTARLTF